MQKRYLLLIVLSPLLIFIFACLVELVLWYHCNMNFHQVWFPSLYQVDFPEEQFPCECHKDQVVVGYQRMKQLRVVFAGLIRNAADSLPNMMEKIEKTGALFRDYQVVVLENDSHDATRSILEKWAQQNNAVHVLSWGGEQEQQDTLYKYGAFSRRRMEKMASLRNGYLRYVKQHYARYDYLIVIDLDIKGPWSLDGLAQTFALQDWDMVAANGLTSFIGTFGLQYHYYDTLAYVREYEVDADLVKWWVPLRYITINYGDLFGVRRCSPLIKVRSAFGGLAIYRMKSIAAAAYQGGVCEHIEFHKAMHQAGNDKLYVNPNLILLSGHQGVRNIFHVL